MGNMDNKNPEVISLRDMGSKSPEASSLQRVTTVEEGEITYNVDGLQRHLGNRQIQLIAIGGSIGTALFVSVGGALHKGGPLGMLLAYTGYACLLALVSNGCAEMTIYMPVSGGYVRQAGKWVDDAFGFAAAWNFYLYEALLIPFEITALNLVLSFWRDDIPVAAVCAACVVCYGLLNVLTVKAYGEAEFWLSSGKILLIFMLFAFTFITMVGGNPEHDAYGFRYWKDPGPFGEYLATGALGKFEGFLGALWAASFCIVGPEYISMVAAEAKRPRIYIKQAFKTVYWRFAIFFIGGALCTGIVIPYNDKTLVAVLSGDSAGGGTAAASPYVIAMQNLHITGFPHLINALLVTSIFSAGNAYTYCATRTLYGLAIEGRAPAVLRKCTKNGVPIYCFAITMVFPFLSFLSVSSSSALVLNWLINLITAGGVIDYIVMSTTYLCFYYACKAQGLDRKTLPYYGYFQPYCGWIGLVGMTLIVFTYGYSTFVGGFSIADFFSYYTMVGVFPILFVFWKVLKKTSFVKANKVDLIWESRVVDAYEASFTTPPVGFWTEMLDLIRFKKRRDETDNRRPSVGDV